MAKEIRGSSAPQSSNARSKAFKTTGTLVCMASAMLIAGAFVMTLPSCGSSKQVTYRQPQQDQPITQQQKQSANRGMKLEKEECEEKALEGTANLREAGTAISDNEALAINLALVDARSKLAQQLEVLVNGMVRNFAQQHTQGQNTGGSIGKGSALGQGYFEQFLRNTRPICKNTYVKEDGRFNVFVCIELGDQEKRTIYRQMRKDDKLEVDFAENQFLQEMQKAKEDYRQQQLQQ